MGRFTDRTAIVTGGAQGIGEAYARALAAEGANVVVADLNAEAGGAGRQADRRGRRQRRLHLRRRRRPGLRRRTRRQDRRGVRWHRPRGQQRRDLRWYEAGPAAHRAVGLLQEVHEREPRRRTERHPRRVAAHAEEGRLDREPVVDRGMALLRLLRPGEGRRQRTDPAARGRTGRQQHSYQRDRPPDPSTPRPPAP